MKIVKNKKKAEAVRRMKSLGIYPETIRQFEKGGFVSISMPPMGAFFWAQDEDLARIRDFEETHNALVYMVVRTFYRELGKLDFYLFVSDEKDEWDADRSGLKNGEALVYVYNHDCDWCSEFGYIGIKKTLAEGLVRTW